MGLAAPLALAFVALYGVLVLLYLWERWRRQVAVPSLLLWEVVREDVIRARRFRPDLLFVLQLLLLTVLIVGLARPYVRRTGGSARDRRHIFVLDTSASMETQEGRRTRFEEARARALAQLRAVPAGDEVMLAGVAPSPSVLLNFTRDHGAAARALAAVQPTETRGDLSWALAFIDGLRRRDIPTTVDVFTDLPSSHLPPRLRDEVTVFQVGETDDNLAIEALQIFQGRFEDYHHARAYVLVENFAHRTGYGFLTIRLGRQIVEHTGFSIAARASQGFLVSHFPGAGLVTARLDVVDALAADNTAFGWIRPVTPLHVLVVSPPSPLLGELRDLAAAVPGLTLRVVAPDAFRAAQARRADVAIFHRFVPAAPPGVNALYVYPPAKNPLFKVLGATTDAEVVDWDARHPALRSLQPLLAVPLRRARIVNPPAWSQVLLWSRAAHGEFPLALAGESNGQRVACLTFDLAAERLLGSDRVNLLLFFMNLLGWLSPSGHDPAVVRTGDVHAFAERGPLRVRDPRGTVSILAAGQTALQPLYAGVYQLDGDGGSGMLLANFFDPTESDIGRGAAEPPVFHAAASAAQQPPAPVPGGPRREYGSWLYAAAAALFVFEWIAARRSGT